MRFRAPLRRSGALVNQCNPDSADGGCGSDRKRAISHSVCATCSRARCARRAVAFASPREPIAAHRHAVSTAHRKVVFFDLEDEVASGVAGVIEPAFQAAKTGSSDRLTNDLTAYDLYLCAYSMFFLPARQILKALHLLESAPCVFAWAAAYRQRMCTDRSSTHTAERVPVSVDRLYRSLMTIRVFSATLS